MLRIREVEMKSRMCQFILTRLTNLGNRALSMQVRRWGRSSLPRECKLAVTEEG